MTTEEIKVTLFDENRKGEQMFARLLDDMRWQRMIREYDEGRGEKTIEELFDELLNRRD
jgi:hypothetical protein